MLTYPGYWLAPETVALGAMPPAIVAPSMPAANRKRNLEIRTCAAPAKSSAIRFTRTMATLATSTTS
jgi:hypothetical protein